MTDTVYRIRHKDTGEIFVSRRGRSTWARPNHASLSWSYGRHAWLNRRAGGTGRFADQSDWEIVEFHLVGPAVNATLVGQAKIILDQAAANRLQSAQLDTLERAYGITHRHLCLYQSALSNVMAKLVKTTESGSDPGFVLWDLVEEAAKLICPERPGDLIERWRLHADTRI